MLFRKRKRHPTHDTLALVDRERPSEVTVLSASRHDKPTRSISEGPTVRPRAPPMSSMAAQRLWQRPYEDAGRRDHANHRSILSGPAAGNHRSMARLAGLRRHHP